MPDSDNVVTAQQRLDFQKQQLGLQNLSYRELAKLAYLAEQLGDQLFSDHVMSKVISTLVQFNYLCFGDKVITYIYQNLPNSGLKKLAIDLYAATCSAEFMEQYGQTMSGPSHPGVFAADVAARFIRLKNVGKNLLDLTTYEYLSSKGHKPISSENLLTRVAWVCEDGLSNGRRVTAYGLNRPPVQHRCS